MGGRRQKKNNIITPSVIKMTLKIILFWAQLKWLFLSTNVRVRSETLNFLAGPTDLVHC